MSGGPRDARSDRAVDVSTERGDDPTIEHRWLRGALEYAVLMAAELGKRKMPAPGPLKQYAGKSRLPTGALGKVRRTVDGDTEFRQRIAAGALPELVDEIGRSWLQRPDGWATRVHELIARAEDEEAAADLRAELRRAEKRRAAAEVAAARARAEVVAWRQKVDDQRQELDVVLADLAKSQDAVLELRAELIDVRNEARHARDREAAAAAKLEQAQVERDEARSSAARSGVLRDEALAARTAAVADEAELRALVDAARRLAERAEAVLPESDRTESIRTPLAIPGGVGARSAEAAEFFVRSGAVVLIDGYNVAKSAWPGDELEQQRNHLLDACENLTRRFGTPITVVFDGASVVGSHTTRRRLVRLVFSPAGVSADDVIRDLVRRHPPAEPIVVVTSDQEIVRDVRAHGANTVPSSALLAVL